MNKEPSAFNVRTVIEEAHANAEYESRQLNKVVTIVHIESFAVLGYPVLLHRAIDDVLRNALRFAQRIVSIEVSRGRTDAGDVGVITIRGDGPGIGPDLEEAIFEPFLTLSLNTEVSLRGSQLFGCGAESLVSQGSQVDIESDEVRPIHT